MAFRILTYNLHQGAASAGPALPRVVDALAARRATIIACQEVLAPTAVGNHAAALGAALDMHATWIANAPVRAGRLGNALLTVRPPLAADRLDVSLPRVQPRGVLRSRLSHDLIVWNVHLGLTRRERRAQWRAIERVLPPPHLPFVLCGDFNDWTGDLDGAICAAGLHNALAAVPRRRRRTFPARLPLLSLDRIYYRGLTLRRGAVLGSDPWARLSDHRPVEADFELAVDTGGNAGGFAC